MINQWVFNIGLLRGGSNNLKKLPLVLDSQSNIYIGGEIPLADVASPTNLNPLGTAVTFADQDAGFIAKYNNSGINQWVISYGDVSDDYVNSMAVDATDNLLVAIHGENNNTKNINPLGTTTNTTSKNIVAKYNSSGILQGHFGFDNMGNQEIKLDNTGNIYYTGSFTDASLDIDPSASTNTLTNNGGSDFYLVSYKSTVFANVLPVSLTTFEAALQDNQTVQLTWQTASEQNNEGFEIQRAVGSRQFAVDNSQAADISEWETIGFVTGNGTTTEVFDYQFVDNLDLGGFQNLRGLNLYYRLKQIDFDGQFEYSNIVNIQLVTGNAQPVTRIYPNPTTDVFYVENETAIGSLIQVFNLQGQLMIEQRHQSIISRIPTDQLDNGTYFIKMGEHVKKLIIAN